MVDRKAPVPQDAARDEHTRELILQGDLQVGIGLVVLQHDVVPRTVLFDQVALQDQGLDLTVRQDGLEVIHVARQGDDLGRMAA